MNKVTYGRATEIAIMWSKVAWRATSELEYWRALSLSDAWFIYADILDVKNDVPLVPDWEPYRD